MDKRLLKFIDRPIAHRGFHDEGRGIVENSLSAFEAAFERNLPIECDLRLTLDGEVVIFHDQTLDRICGVNLVVEESTLSELKKYKLKDSNESIPTLKELLEIAGDEHPLLLELKIPKFNGRLEAAVRDLIDGRQDQIAIQSFHPISMWWWQRNAPSFLRGLVSGDLHSVEIPKWQRLLVEHLAMGPLVKPHFISYQGDLLSRAVLSLIDLPIFAWTVKERVIGERYLADGASNIIFEGFEP